MIAEKLYGELTRDILIRHSPMDMQLKVDRVKFAPDKRVVQDSFINPTLVKKRPENSLNLPTVYTSQDSQTYTTREFVNTSLQKLNAKIQG